MYNNYKILFLVYFVYYFPISQIKVDLVFGYFF